MSDMKSSLSKDDYDQSAGSRVNYEDYNQLSSRRIGIKLLSYYRMKNARRTMEDKITLLPDLDMIFKVYLKLLISSTKLYFLSILLLFIYYIIQINTEMSYFAVFDGHNGIEAAAYGSAQLHQFLIKNVQSGMKIPQALQLAFAQTDSAFMAKCNDEQIRSGTTAVVVVITEMKVYIAWAGDCQASIHFDAVKAKQLVSCHKPDREVSNFLDSINY
jgi:serine/threonine protein phosphatase PrpC